MKKFLLLVSVLLTTGIAFSQSMKMVVDSNGNPIGKYVKTNASTYTVEAQDDFQVPIEGHKIVEFEAVKGQGVVVGRDFGTVNVRNIPSTQGTIVGKIIYEEGELPPTYPCLGKENGWYKINIDGQTGYVREDLVGWDGMDLF